MPRNGKRCEQRNCCNDAKIVYTNYDHSYDLCILHYQIVVEEFGRSKK